MNARLLLLLSSLIVSQALADDEARPPERAAVVQEALPATFYLKDEKGKLVPTPGITYERFRELLLLERQLGSEARPTVQIVETRVVAQATNSPTGHEQQLEFTANIKIRLHQSGWQWAALGFREAILREPPTVKSGEKDTVPGIHRYDAAAGHGLWLNGQTEVDYLIALPLRAGINTRGMQRQVKLSLPSQGSSRVELELPAATKQLQILAGEGVIEREPSNEARVALIDAQGEIELGWKLGEPQGSKPAASFEASAEIEYRVPSRDAISARVKLHVQREASAIDAFFVRLPPRFELVEQPADGYRVSVMAENDSQLVKLLPKKPPAGTWVRVTCDQPATSFDGSLLAEYKPDPTGKRGPVELNGFEVLGATRQLGQITLVGPAGWLLKTTTDANVFRVDDLDAALDAKIAGRYRYLRQPYSLKLDVQPQATKTQVETVHRIQVRPGEARLETTLHFRLRGLRPEYLELDPGDWTLLSSQSAEFGKLEAPQEAGKPLRFQLTAEGPAEFTWKLPFRKSLTTGSDTFVADLPRCLVAQLVPAQVEISAAPNLNLVPLESQIKNLQPAGRGTASDAGSSYSFIEIPNATEKSRFAATLQQRPRVADARLHLLATPRRDHLSIQETWEFRVANEPFTELRFVASAPDFAATSLTATWNNEPLPLEKLDDSETAGAYSCAVPLSPPLLGTGAMQFTYRVPLSTNGSTSIPLLLPDSREGIRILSQSARLMANNGGELRFASTDNSNGDPREDTEELTWTDSRTSLTIEPSRQHAAQSGARLAREAWWQVALWPTGRRDRLVVSVDATVDTLDVELPLGVDAERIEVFHNGEAPRDVSLNERTLHIELQPPSEAHLPSTVEVWCFLPAATSDTQWQTVPLDVPRLKNTLPPQRAFFQLVTTADMVALGTPPGFSRARAWRNAHGIWQLGNAWTTAELEERFHLRPDAAAEESFNEELFVSLGQPESLRLVLVSGRWLWFVVGLTVLAAGWITWYLCAKRLLIVLLGLCGATFLGAIAAPDIAATVAAAWGLGVLLLTASLWSLRFMATAQPRFVEHAREPSTMLRRGDSQAKSSRMLASTAAAPLAEPQP